MFFSPLYLIMVAPALLLGIWAQMKVTSAFNHFSRVPVSSGLTGAQAAARMLQGKGFQIVQSEDAVPHASNIIAIVETRGFLSDHYDPSTRTLRLSPSVYEGNSLASVGVACHEAGHALQHAQNYAPLNLRSLMVPIASFGAPLAIPLIVIGAIFAIPILIPLGILLFTTVVIFQLITLPVEFDASRRAKRTLAEMGMIQSGEEAAGVASVLNAAAWTYVAAAVSSIMTLLYYLMVFSGNRRGN
ncbi:TPA: zinc metallopeptidase [Candidatus Sumerlaeota bacterium]|jgi:uncharacterized protein|nr:zinc metallopeptidase [Candidatus Sumerlaeota bacterium]